MTESQRKILACVVLAGCCSLVEMIGLTATLTDGGEGNCPPGIYCAVPTRTLHTLIGDYDGRDISHEQFASYRIQLIAIAMVIEIMCLVVLIKTLREQEAQKKREDSSVGMGIPSE